jgi:hypothetical protein
LGLAAPLEVLKLEKLRRAGVPLRLGFRVRVSIAQEKDYLAMMTMHAYIADGMQQTSNMTLLLSDTMSGSTAILDRRVRKYADL